MRPSQALKDRNKGNSESKELDKKPTLLDILRERNRELQMREQRTVLLRRIGKR